MKIKNNYHPSALLTETIKYLHIENQARRTGKMIDTTLGNAGHAIEFLKKGKRVLGLEYDRRALSKAEGRLDAYWRKKSKDKNVKPYVLVNANFNRIAEIARRNNFERVDAILFDLGLNQGQQVSQIRGFSFSNPDANLDMRVNPDIQGVTGSDLLNSLSESQLKDLFKRVLKTGESIRLAREIVRSREVGKFEKVGDFLRVCEKIFKYNGKTHPATRAFLALRMAVNSELQNLEDALKQSMGLLVKNGRVAVISFHSAEDGLVKKIMKDWETVGLGRQITKKPIGPTPKEIDKNKLSRSARMRVFEKIVI